MHSYLASHVSCGSITGSASDSVLTNMTDVIVANREDLELKSAAGLETVRPFLVVDDHDVVRKCLLPLIATGYPQAEILVATDCQEAITQLEKHSPSLVLTDIYLPNVLGEMACYETGIQLLRHTMAQQPAANILVFGTSVKPLVRLSAEIYHYPAGFTALDKVEPIERILKMVDLALRGSIYLPTEVRWQGGKDDSRLGLKAQWLALLTYKFQAGLSDRAIAERMGISTRTVRSYWLRLQDSLGVFDDPDKDLRVQIEHAARRAGLID